MRREVEVDTKLAENYEAVLHQERLIDSHMNTIRHYTGQEREYVRYGRGYTRRWTGTAQEAETQIRTILEAGKEANKGYHNGYSFDTAVRAVEGLDAARAEIQRIKDESKPLNDEYAEKRWSRFFLVTSSNHGHIHASMHCSTCRPTTTYAWLPELSGLTEKDAVEAQGPNLCSRCFPEAPVEWTYQNRKGKK